MRCALTTGRPSSLTATAPAPTISPNSASDSPFCPTEIAPIGSTRAACHATRLADDEADRRLVVGNGFRVRHRADRGEAARRCGARTRRDRLDVLASGLAQVAVHIDEAGRDVRSRAVEHLRAIGMSKPASDRLDLPAAHQHVRDLVASRGGIDHVPTLQQKIAHRVGHQRSPPLAPFAASASSGFPPASR